MHSRLPGLARYALNEVPDAELLRRYATERSDEDFSQLVLRYSRLVWGQCRHLLANDADAEDAFQATFVVLARSVRKLSPGAPLGPWLQGTAYRVCLKVLRARTRRTRGERAAAAVREEHSQPVADSIWESAFAALCEEVHQLPESQRAAFVLCGLEGRTQVDAAASLGQKIGAFSARLKRAKQTLMERLAKRGFGAGAIALGTVTGSAAVAPAALHNRTLSLLSSDVAVPSSILVLTQGVTGMAISRFKVLVTGILVASCLSISAVSGLYGNASGQPPFGTTKPASSNFQSAHPPAKAEADLQKAQADYEKAKMVLEQAAQELSKKLAEAKAAERQAGKFEYVPVPKEGFTVEEFERKIAEQEQNGWSYSGEATIRNNQGTGRMLVFRNKTRTPHAGPEKLDVFPPATNPLLRP